MNPITTGSVECGLTRSFRRMGPLSPEELGYLQFLGRHETRVGPRRKLIDDGRPYKGALILKQGWVVEFKQLPDGGRQILTFRLPGEILGMECLVYRTALHSASTLTSCTLANISREDFDHAQRRFPRLANGLLLLTLRDQAILHNWTTNLGRRPAFSRVSHLLLELVRRANIRGIAEGYQMPFPLTQQDIADCTGITVPYVSRILTKMRRMGLLHLGEQSLKICDLEVLTKAAGFRPDYLQIFPRMPAPTGAAREENLGEGSEFTALLQAAP